MREAHFEYSHNIKTETSMPLTEKEFEQIREEAERWVPIKDYEGRYMISNMGRVKSLFGAFNKPGRVLKTPVDSHGYPVVHLRSIEKGRIFKVHRLVASYFIDNPQNKPQVNHINGIRNDNRAVNLEWATESDNQLHSFRVLKRAAKKGIDSPVSKLKEKDVIKILTSSESHRKLANKFGVSKSTIYSIKVGRTWNELYKSIRQ